MDVELTVAPSAPPAPPIPRDAPAWTADLCAAGAGLAWGAAPPGPLGLPLFLVGAALAGRSLTGHRASDALRGVLCGWCWHLVGARWIIAPLADFGDPHPDGAWAALTLLQGALVAVPWLVASAALRRVPAPVALALGWAASVEALAYAQPLPVSPADLSALPPLLGPAAWGGTSLQAGVAVLVGASLPRPTGWALLAGWISLHLAVDATGRAVPLALIQPGTPPLEGRVSSTAPDRADALRRLVPPDRLALLPESAWPHDADEAPPDLPGPVVIGVWTDGGQHLWALDRGRVVDRFAKQLPTPRTEPPLPPSDARRRLDVAELRLGPLLCYEDLHPSAVRAALRHDPDLLLVAANDGWTDVGRGSAWHLQHARLVAAASGRYVARVAMTGTTALLDPRGVVLREAPSGPARLDVEAPRRHPAWTGAAASVWVSLAAGAAAAIAATGRRPRHG